MAPRRRRTRTTVAALVGVTLATALVAACGAAHRAMDCLHTADSIADDVTDLQQAEEGGSDHPGRAGDALNAIQRNLGRIGDRTDDGDVNKAVDDLRKAVGGVRAALRNGEGKPDLTPVTDAAGELTKVCTP
jgi:hypothetical protein